MRALGHPGRCIHREPGDALGCAHAKDQVRAAFREAVLWLGKQRVTERMHAAPRSRRARAQSNNWSCGRSNAAPCAPHSQECIRCADCAKVPQCAHRFTLIVCLSAHYIRNKFDYGGKLFSFGVRPAGRQRTPAFVVGRDNTRIIDLQCARIAWSSKIIRLSS